MHDHSLRGEPTDPIEPDDFEHFDAVDGMDDSDLLVPEGETEKPKNSAKGEMLFQADVHYKPTGIPPRVCQSCRWFSIEPNTSPCLIVINDGPEIITPDGTCDRWEAVEEGSSVVVNIVDVDKDNPNLAPNQPPLGKPENDEVQDAES